ncbi:MAG: hypothetical protein V3U65_12705 [Granulosicoccaceae bacterium]
MPTQLIAALVAVATQFSAPGECHTALDTSRTLYSEGDKKASYNLLIQMQAFCTDFPQIEHNLGVLAISNRQYDAGIKHFENSLQQDRRSQDTVDQLQSVRAYQASIAYSEALQLSSRASKPSLTMQDSTYLNSHTPPLSRSRSDLHNISTVEYELYDWWQSARDNNKEAWLSHYEQQYPPPPDAMTAPVDWQKTLRRINFTAQDAVAIISYQSKGARQHRQLLMRLQGNRWKIYQEFQLQ